ncbi:MAG: M18 family aminopeptidase [Lachnospiraceae bacterium]
MDKRIAELAAFIKDAPTAFHAVEKISSILRENGFEELEEKEKWHVEPGKDYYVTRNHSSIIAFKAGEELSDYSFRVTASHSDSPTFKLKENAELEIKKKYTVLNTEGYGGMICSSWFDRPLSVAGRVIVKTDKGMETRLVKVDRDLLMIPSLAIHMDRTVNDGHAFNKQKDMLPLLSGKVKDPGAVKRLAAGELGVPAENICGMDLFLYNRMEPSVWGYDNEFFSCPQLDDLQCAYASLTGFLEGKSRKNVNVYACFDNEEVGSGTKQGAGSTFLFDALWRINRALGKDEEEFFRAVAKSFMLSCDNAHAVHPNYKEKTDETNCVYMNEGIVVKSHAGQKYTSDALSIALFREVCEKAEVPVQFFANRSDAVGGSTLGNIAMSQVSMNAVDIGLPQLAMHSAYETCGVKDTEYLIKASEFFYSCE